MKALTNILTHLLMLLMIFIMACTEEAVEVDNLSRQEQHVTVRMQVPGMTATATRADDGAITSITALAFGSEGNLLGTSGATDISNVNADGGYNGTFTLSVPNDTKTIHFLANLPNNVNIPQSGSQTDVLRGLTTTDTSNLIYWGVAEYTGSNLFVDLYRNMAMIAIAPAVVDTEFNEFEENELFIAGLYNANQSGTLVPYKEAFNFNLNENDYYTLPEPLDKSNEKYNEPYSASTYVFEHENTRREPLCAICEIGKSFYKVALVDDRTGEPYDIIRNHKYIIYVSDVDDYQTSTYQADSYENALEKEPINLDVDEVKMVSFTYDNSVPLNLNDNETFSVTVRVPEVKGGSLTAIYIEADDFDVTADSGLTDPDEGVYTYTASMNSETTLTFTPKSAGSKSIVITGEAVNMEVPRTEISVAVNATIEAAATPENPTLYYDSENPQTETIDVIIPKGVTALDIDADDFTVKQGETSLTYDGTKGVYTYSRGDATTQVYVDFVFTLKDDVTADSSITFSDASSNPNVTDKTVVINVEATPQQGEEVVIYGIEHNPLETGIVAENQEVKYLLLDLANNQEKTGKAESYRSYFKSGATIKIEFTCNVTESWHGANLHMEIGTTWSSAKFANYTYDAKDNNQPKPLIYEFESGDIGTTDNTDTVYGAGLQLLLRFVTVTKISIIPAPTTNN